MSTPATPIATPRPTTPEAVDDLARQIIARVSTKRAVFDLVHIRAEAERSVRRYGLSETAENTLVDDLVRAATSGQISTRIDAIDPVTEPDDMRRADGTSVYLGTVDILHGSTVVDSTKIRVE